MDVYGGGQSGDISDGDDSEIAVMSPACVPCSAAYDSSVSQ